MTVSFCPSSDLCHHRRDVHRGRYHRLLHIHSLWGLEENPDRQNVMSSVLFACQWRLLFMPAKPLSTHHHTPHYDPYQPQRESCCVMPDQLFFLCAHSESPLIWIIPGLSFGGCRWFPYFTAISNSSALLNAALRLKNCCGKNLFFHS